ncbi:MAG TPA: PEP-CTERM sorting domain-containing protein [Bryobacteraceae bacterium]|jgi:hypothetical protein|nr:PEP-CTERM sorting domain-containing protein [Bryobacteraceae bacterium]
MKNHTGGYLAGALLLASIAPATASTINVTDNSEVTLGTGDSLIFYICADNACGGQTLNYPGEIEVLLGGMPVGGPVASIPGTSGVYLPGILLTGAVESQDGSVSMPLTDSNAVRLGLPDGELLLAPGSRSGGSYSGPLDLVSGDATIGSQEAAVLFASGEVAIDLHNTGAAITFGYPGSSIASDFTATLVSRDGSRSLGARVLSVEQVQTPEPGTIGLLLIGLTILGTRLAHARHLG